ncbi:MAG: prolyl oligopeptidase family serine peptidase [Steroidobacteraceae bacterium]
MRKFIAVVSLLLAAPPAFVAEGKPVPPSIAVLAAYPKMSGFTVSPDGAHLAAMEARGEDRVILVWKTDALSAPPTVIGSTKMKLQRVEFIKNDTLAVTLWQPYDLRFDNTTKTFISKLYFTDLAGKNWREPLQQPVPRSKVQEIEQSLSSPSVLDDLPNDPANVLVVNNTGSDQGDIYKVEVASGRAVRVQRADEKTGGYITDLDGDIRGRVRLDTDDGGAFVATEIRDTKSGAWQQHFKSYAKARDVVTVVGFSTDPNIAYVLSNVGRDKAAIYAYDIAARKLGEVVFEHKFFDATGMGVWHIKDANFGQVEYFIYDGPREGDFYFNSAWSREMDARVAKALGIVAEPQQLVDPATGDTARAAMRMGRDWRPLSISQDRKVMVFAADSPNEAATYYLLKDNNLTVLTKAYPDIDPRALGQTKLVYYKARDGLDIPAFLHTPSTDLCGPGPWKTVIHPHGGPWARDALGFDGSMWVPLMVSRCMAVLQPQYRGSQGWGRKLWMAGDREWGQKMQDDKDDGAKWLIDQKIAQPGHIAMFGFSYGGYASMAAAVRPNGLYKCAIAGAGVSDIDRIWAKYFTNVFFREGQSSTVQGLSPLSKADQIQIPIYVYHGDRDQTVPIEQSQWFVNKAKGAGKDVTWREFKDYAHGPAWTRQTMGEQLKGIEDYFAKGCGGSGL